MKRLYIFTLLVCFALNTQAQEFLNDIQIPPLVVYNNQGSYDLDMIQTAHNFNPKGTDSLNTMVPTFCFEDFNNPGTTTILGPTIKWDYLTELNPTVLNRLPEQSTCHWHGAHVPQSADGGPYQIIQPDELWEPKFKVLDKSATMWYHPHAMDLTYKHVQMGLSGMIYVEDPVDDPTLSFWHDVFPTEYGVNDIPLIFQTKKFERDVATGQIIIQAEQGFKKDFYYMVNGIVDPVLNVPADMVRLRLLNGDGKFAFNFAFRRSDGSSFPAELIATDAGYVEQTHTMENILMAPGERTEVLLDLRGIPEGTELFVFNNVSGMPSGVVGNGVTGNTANVDRNLLKIVVGEFFENSAIIGFPLSVLPSEAPAISEVDNVREKVFRQDSFFIPSAGKNEFVYNIDSMLMDMTVVNDVVNLGDTEIWTLDNQSNVAHPFHIHDIHFWVTEILDKSTGEMLNPADYPEIFAGPKDNVLVQPNWKLSFIGTFDDFGTTVEPTNSYMFHCHILPHEDKGMMGTFVVWNGETTSVEETSTSAIAMDVFPNPAQNMVYLKGASSKPSTLRFINLNGQLIKEMSLPSFDGAIELGVETFPSGMMIMDWQTVEGSAKRKIMINN